MSTLKYVTDGTTQAFSGSSSSDRGLTKLKRRNIRDRLEKEHEDHLKHLCHQASVACLQSIHNHVLEYLDKNINTFYKYQHHVDQDSSDSDSDNDSDGRSGSSCCSYEDWIRQYHPDNANGEESMDEKLPGNEIDLRFYLQDSDHRIIWNSYVDAFGCPELKVSPISGLLQKQQQCLRRDQQ